MKNVLVILKTAAFLIFCSFYPAGAENLFGWQWHSITDACDEKCSVMILGGNFVETPMTNIFLKGDVVPFSWEYGDSTFVGFSASRKVASFWHDRFAIEPEVGIGKRFGGMDESEIWAAIYLRYDYFPWNHYLFTTVAVSTGLNYASGISTIEKARAGNGRGDRLMHYLSPEITFALPQDKSKELVVRFHHRSGAYGIVSEAEGGAQYLNLGFRLRF
jgi:hypothetical protein